MIKELTMERISLPVGWEMKTLGDLSEVITKGTTPTSVGHKFVSEGINFIKVESISLSGNFISKKFGHITEEGHNALKRSQLKNGDILFSIAGALGRTAIVNDEILPANTNQALSIIRLKEDSTFLNEYILSTLTSGYTIEQVENLKGGVAQQNLSLGQIKSFQIPLPPLPEQKQIVATLDKAFASLDTAKANAEENLQNAKELFESYLQNVFENKGDDWVISTIGESCNLMTGGTPSRSKKEYFDNGTINWLVSGDINKKIINDCDGKITELGFENSSTRFLPLNSVMIALNGQGKTRGTVAMLRIKAACNQSLVSIYPKDDKGLKPELVYANLEGRYNEIRKITGDGGNDRRGLNMPLIRKISFSYPKNIIEQGGIIAQLDALKSQTKKLESIYTQKIANLEEMKKAILEKAFSGQLCNIN